jgi:hypothetical protein
MEKKKINDFKVKPIKIPKDSRPVKGGFLFPKPYCTVFLLGKKESGKTNTLFNIMCNRIESNTTIVIFSSTIYSDDNWIAIRKFFEEKEIPTIYYTGIYEQHDNTRVNKLQELVSQLEDEAIARDEAKKEEKKKKKEKKLKIIKTDDDSDSDDEEKEKKPKKIAADYIIIIDDLSNEIKDKSLETLIKKHRHYHTMILLSNQTLNDVTVATRKNLDFWILCRHKRKETAGNI